MTQWCRRTSCKNTSYKRYLTVNNVVMLSLREPPFNLKVMVFSKKNILIPNVAEKKYSDFGGGKKK